MESRPIGESGVLVSTVGLGGFELGPEFEEEPDVDRAVLVIDTALAEGVNWLDTSEEYFGMAERVADRRRPAADRCHTSLSL